MDTWNSWDAKQYFGAQLFDEYDRKSKVWKNS